MQLIIENYQSKEIVEKIAELFETSSENDCLEDFLTIPEKIGKGKIFGFQFSDGISLICFDTTLKEDLKITLNHGEPPLQFNFNVSGNIRHILDEDNIHYQLNPLRGTITAGMSNNPQILHFQGKQPIKFACLLIKRSDYREKVKCILEQMPDRLAKIFTDVFAEKPFFYHSNYSIAIAECINQIIKDKNGGIVRSTLVESKALELISMQVKQYKDDLLMPGKQVMLRKYDVEKIKTASEILLENIDKNITIAELAKKTGINRQKLKEGFKQIFDKTVHNFVRDQKLEKAALLLLNEHSVREAAQSVGYRNLGHFAKRFKDKYGVLPIEYKKSIHAKITDNQGVM